MNLHITDPALCRARLPLFLERLVQQFLNDTVEDVATSASDTACRLLGCSCPHSIADHTRQLPASQLHSKSHFCSQFPFLFRWTLTHCTFFSRGYWVGCLLACVSRCTIFFCHIMDTSPKGAQKCGGALLAECPPPPWRKCIRHKVLHSHRPELRLLPPQSCRAAMQGVGTGAHHRKFAVEGMDVAGGGARGHCAQGYYTEGVLQGVGIAGGGHSAPWHQEEPTLL